MTNSTVDLQIPSPHRASGHGAPHIIAILEDEELPANRMVMGHLDIVPDIDYHRQVLKRGAYVEYDQPGREYYAEEMGLCWGHDMWRVQALAQLVAEGYENQLVLAQDVALKMDLLRFGGNGYGYILRWIVPMLERAGVSDRAIFKMLVDNPRRILTVDWDEDVLRADEYSLRQGKLEQTLV